MSAKIHHKWNFTSILWWIFAHSFPYELSRQRPPTNISIATEQGVLFDRKTKTFYRDQLGDSDNDIIDSLVDAYLSLEAYVINQSIL